MAQPLLLEDYFPSPSEMVDTPEPPHPTAEDVRAIVASYADSVRTLETVAGRFIEGGKALVDAARKAESERIEETVSGIEGWEREPWVADFQRIIAETQEEIRRALRSRHPELRVLYVELRQRDKAARQGALGAMRETRWRLMAILAEREPIKGTRELRSLGDVAALFGDDETTTH
jgi:hypothetical protein